MNAAFKTSMALLVVVGMESVGSELPRTCTDNIYCFGNLLHTVQMSRVFKDSKTFVDMKMKFDRAEIQNEFDGLMDRTRGRPGKAQLSEFVRRHFDEPGSEFEDWTPEDWKENPKILSEMTDRDAKRWVSDLNGLWKRLGRKMKSDVKTNPDKYSIIYVPNPVIVPGGRFREFYYWDSYWIVRGLLRSEMFTTVKGMLSNFVSMVDRFGFVPNGGRVYYTTRSQPPLLIPMFKTYLETTGDYDFLRQNIHGLEKELQFWLNNRTVSVTKGSKSYILVRYSDFTLGPRPESYYEDVDTAEQFSTEQEKIEFYSQVKSAAESGWDFSSRWFKPENDLIGELKDVKTRSVVPVDLNAIICANAETLSEFFESLDDHKKALVYARMANKFKIAVNKILWHDDVGSWLDYDLENGGRRNEFYASNLFPLWTKCYDHSRSDLVDKILDYTKKNKIHGYVGGVPNSLSDTGQQWDYPNAWPPSQYAIVYGLDATDDACAKKYARNLAVKWIRSNFQAYKQTGAMYEKYDATIFGGHGGGGEYEVQLGFGWSNGVIMDLLHKYPDAFTAPLDSDLEHCSRSDAHPSAASSNLPPFFPLLTPIFVLFSLKLDENYVPC